MPVIDLQPEWIRGRVTSARMRSCDRVSIEIEDEDETIHYADLHPFVFIRAIVGREVEIDFTQDGFEVMTIHPNERNER